MASASASATTLSPAAFNRLASAFAARSAGLTPTWAWVDPSDIDDGGPFGPPPTGYLHASPLLLPADAAPSQSGARDDDEAELECARPARLLLHIVHSATYEVPVLLLQGYDAGGSVWGPAATREPLLGNGLVAGVSQGVITLVSRREPPRAPPHPAVPRRARGLHPARPPMCADGAPCAAESLLWRRPVQHGRADGRDARHGGQRARRARLPQRLVGRPRAPRRRALAPIGVLPAAGRAAAAAAATPARPRAGCHER